MISTAAIEGPYGMMAPFANGTDHQLNRYANPTKQMRGWALTALRIAFMASHRSGTRLQRAIVANDPRNALRMQQLVAHQPSQRLSYGPRFLTVPVVDRPDATQVSRRLRALQKLDGLTTASWQKDIPVASRVGWRAGGLMTEVSGVVMRLPVRDVRQVRPDRSPVGPRCKAPIRRSQSMTVLGASWSWPIRSEREHAKR